MTAIDPYVLRLVAIGYAFGRQQQFSSPIEPLVAQGRFVEAVLDEKTEITGFADLWERIARETAAPNVETPKAA